MSLRYTATLFYSHFTQHRNFFRIGIMVPKEHRQILNMNRFL